MEEEYDCNFMRLVYINYYLRTCINVYFLTCVRLVSTMYIMSNSVIRETLLLEISTKLTRTLTMR